MPTVGNLTVNLLGTTHGFTKAMSEAEQQLQKFGQQLDRIGQRMSIAVTAPILAVGGAAAKMAMDTVEAENLFEVSMGRMADAARQWSQELRTQLGLNEYEVRKNVGTFKVMLESMGLGERAAYDMSKGLTQLAYDMSSFYNLRPDEAFQKLQAGMAGAVEPLQRLGIVIKETQIEEYALRTGLIKQGETLSETGKVLARYGLIMEATQKAQGDLARTLDSPTNKLRILQEQIKATAIDFGMTLLPTVEKLIDAAKPLISTLGELVKWFSSLPQSVQSTIAQFTLLVAAIGPAAVVIGKLALALSGPAGLVAAGIAAAGALAGLVRYITDVQGRAESASKAAAEHAKELMNERARAEELTAKFKSLTEQKEKLESKTRLTKEESEKLAKIQGDLKTVSNDLAQIIPTAVKAWDDEKNAIIELNDVMKELVRLRKAEYDERAKAAGALVEAKRAELDDLRRELAAMKEEAQAMVAAAKETAEPGSRGPAILEEQYNRTIRELEAKILKAEADLRLLVARYRGVGIEAGGGYRPVEMRVVGGEEEENVTTKASTTRTVTDVLKEMNAALAQAVEKEKLLGDAFDLNAEKANIFARAMDELIKLGLKAEDVRLTDIRARWLSIQPGRIADENLYLMMALNRQSERAWNQATAAMEKAAEEAATQDLYLRMALNRQTERAWNQMLAAQEKTAKEAADDNLYLMMALNRQSERAWNQMWATAQNAAEEAATQDLYLRMAFNRQSERTWNQAMAVMARSAEEAATEDLYLKMALNRQSERAWNQAMAVTERSAQEAATENLYLMMALNRQTERAWNQATATAERAAQEAAAEDLYLRMALNRQSERAWNVAMAAQEKAAEEAATQDLYLMMALNRQTERAWNQATAAMEKAAEEAATQDLYLRMALNRQSERAWNQTMAVTEKAAEEAATENLYLMMALNRQTERAWQASVTIGERLGIDAAAISAALKGGGIDLSGILATIEKQWNIGAIQVAAGIGEPGSLLQLKAEAVGAAIDTLVNGMIKEGMTTEQVKAAIEPFVIKLKELKDAIWRVQVTTQLANALLSGLAEGLAEAGNAWTDFLSVVVSSIKLATDDAGKIIGVDFTQTLVNIASYGLRRLGQAIADLFGGAERLRRQYPGGAYGVVNYPDLAQMRRNYEQWNENFQALQQAQQAQAGMTVGGGLLGGFLGFLIGGPIGALIGAGLGAGVGYAAGQATYGPQIEELKKKLEDTFQKIAETLGTTISDVAGALGNAFSAETYQEFLSGFATNLEDVVKQGLIKAFMAGEAMRPLLQGLSDFITVAVWDGTLDAAEKLQLAQKFQEIVGVAAPFWEALQQFDFVEAVGGATEALNEFSEALRNVPTGFKIASARWEAALPAYQEGGVVGQTGVAVLHAGERVIPAGESGGDIHIHLEGATFYGDDDFERKIMAAVSKATRRAGLTRHGLATGVSY